MNDDRCAAITFPTVCDNDIGALMLRRFALFLMCALTLTMGVSSVAHAMEPIGCATEAAESLIAHDDSTQNKEIEGELAQHMHGACHGHHLSTTPGATSPAPYIFIADLVPPIQVAGHVTNAAAPALRPPIA